jgi:hypothetical protein
MPLKKKTNVGFEEEKKTDKGSGDGLQNQNWA